MTIQGRLGRDTPEFFMRPFRAMDLARGFAPKVSAGDNRHDLPRYGLLTSQQTAIAAIPIRADTKGSK